MSILILLVKLDTVTPPPQTKPYSQWTAKVGDPLSVLRVFTCFHTNLNMPSRLPTTLVFRSFCRLLIMCIGICDNLYLSILSFNLSIFFYFAVSFYLFISLHLSTNPPTHPSIHPSIHTIAFPRWGTCSDPDKLARSSFGSLVSKCKQSAKSAMGPRAETSQGAADKSSNENLHFPSVLVYWRLLHTSVCSVSEIKAHTNTYSRSVVYIHIV